MFVTMFVCKSDKDEGYEVLTASYATFLMWIVIDLVPPPLHNCMQCYLKIFVLYYIYVHVPTYIKVYYPFWNHSIAHVGEQSWPMFALHTYSVCIGLGYIKVTPAIT